MTARKIYAFGMIGLLTAVLIVSCTKSFDEKTVQQTDFSNSTVVQVALATVGASRNYVYLDGKQITGSLMTSGSIFPSTGYGSTIPGGLHSFQIKDTLRTSTQVPLTFSENMQVGSNYTIFVYDTITSPKQVTVPTSIVIPTDTTVRLRFANFIYNSFAIPGVDIYSYDRQANIFTNVLTTEVTNFIAYPSRRTDTLYFRETGTMNQLFKLTISGGLTERRSYTLLYRGSHRGTRTTTLFANY
jgi:hypothetical protein